MARDDTQLTRAIAMAMCDAIDGPCICKGVGAPDLAFGGCWQAYQAALAAWPHVVSVTHGFQSLGPRPDAPRRTAEPHSRLSAATGDDLPERLRKAAEGLHLPPSIQSQRNLRAMNALDEAAKEIERLRTLPQALPMRPDSIYSKFHLDNWTDDDFAKHSAATRKTLAYLIELEAAVALPRPHRQGAQNPPTGAAPTVKAE